MLKDYLMLQEEVIRFKFIPSISGGGGGGGRGGCICSIDKRALLSVPKDLVDLEFRHSLKTQVWNLKTRESSHHH